MRRDKISIRYRQVSILRRWSITTLSRHQFLRDELCFIFCYRLNVAKRRCRHCSQRIAEKESVWNCERAYMTWRTNRASTNAATTLFVFFCCFPCSPTREPWVNTLALCRPSCPLARCDAYVYTALHICMCVCMYKHVCNCRYAHEQCSRLRVKENDFTVWRNFKTSEGAAERAKKYGTT